jgi:hypothetical protein
MRVWLLVSGALTWAATLQQETPVNTLGTPQVEFPQPFTEIHGLHELRDGRVIVNDYRDRSVKLVDFRARAASQLGRIGSGPGEYQLPLNLIAFPGDSVAVYDMGAEGRMMLFNANGATGTSIATPSAQPGGARISEGSRTDSRGRIYSFNRQTSNDSIGVERFDRATGRREILAYVSPYVISSLRARPAGRSSRGGNPDGGMAAARGPEPFFTIDQWDVAPDGRVAVVSADPYRVTFTEVDGRRWSAPPIPFQPVRLTDAHKSLWREMRGRPVASLSSAGRGNMVAGFRSFPVDEPAEWPQVLPAFLPDAVRFAPNGMLWVRRTTAADRPPTFDLIDRMGRVAMKVVMPTRSRLVGFGANSVYAVRRDADDLEYLQRYALPMSGGRE